VVVVVVDGEDEVEDEDWEVDEEDVEDPLLKDRFLSREGATFVVVGVKGAEAGVASGVAS
jgi:hypothetical protein